MQSTSSLPWIPIPNIADAVMGITMLSYLDPDESRFRFRFELSVLFYILNFLLYHNLPSSLPTIHDFLLLILILNKYCFDVHGFGIEPIVFFIKNQV